MVYRTLFSLGAACLLLSASAQDALGRARSVAEIAGISDPAREKALSEALNDWDPTSIQHIDRSSGMVELLTLRPVERQELNAWLSVNGFTLRDLKQWNPRTDRLEEVRATASGVPTYIDTGDAFNDNKAYDRAKAAWIAEHGERSTPDRGPTQNDAEQR